MIRYAFFTVALLFFIHPVFVVAATDEVQVQLLVNNGTSTSTTTSDTSTSTASSGTFGNGQPQGPLSPNGNTEPMPPLLQGNVVIVPDRTDSTSFSFQWKTSVPASATLEWGPTLFYGSGKVSIPINALQNKGFEGYLYEQNIQQLSPGEHYFYRLTVRDETGRVAGYQGVYEIPLSPPEHLPQNISGLTVESATTTHSQIQNVLRWTNPDESDISGVRVVRSPFGFPKDPLDGKVVYEGAGETAIDTFDPGDVKTYFYTVFVKGKNGEYSSGSVATNVVIERPSRLVATVPEIARLTAEDFLVTLYDSADPESSRKKALLLDNGRLLVSGSEKMTISVDFDKFPQILKTIVVYITPSRLATDVLSGATGPQKNLHSFLLSVNAQSTAYEATFLAPSEGGDYDVEVKILDYHNELLRNITAKHVLNIEKSKTKFQIVLENGKSQFLKAEKPLILAILTALILLTLALRKIVRFF